MKVYKINSRWVPEALITVDENNTIISIQTDPNDITTLVECNDEVESEFTKFDPNNYDGVELEDET